MFVTVPEVTEEIFVILYELKHAQIFIICPSKPMQDTKKQNAETDEAKYSKQYIQTADKEIIYNTQVNQNIICIFARDR